MSRLDAGGVSAALAFGVAFPPGRAVRDGGRVTGAGESGLGAGSTAGAGSGTNVASTRTSSSELPWRSE